MRSAVFFEQLTSAIGVPTLDAVAAQALSTQPFEDAQVADIIELSDHAAQIIIEREGARIAVVNVYREDAGWLLGNSVGCG